MTRKTGSTVSNMTEGSIWKELLSFFFPLLAGNLFQQFYSVVDSIVVGKGIGDAALAAVGTTGSVNFLILGFVIGLTRGFGVHFAQDYGNGNESLLRREVFQAAMLSIIVSLSMTAMCLMLLPRMMAWMNTPEDILAEAIRYFRWILIGITFTVMNNLCMTLLQSLGDSRTPLSAMIFSSVSNIILDFLFVFPLHMGVDGAAIATVLSQILSAAWCLHRIRSLPELAFQSGERKLNGRLCGELIATGLPVAVMNSITAFGGMVLQVFVNGMGTAAVAAYAVCMKYAGLFEQSGQAAGLTVMTFVGQNYGAAKFDRIREGVRKGLLLTVIGNLPIAFLEIVLPVQIASVMASSEQVLSQCAIMLPILGFCIFGLGFLFIYRNACQAMGNTILPMLSGFLEVAMRLGVGFLIGRQSLRGIAIAEVSAWIAAAVMLAATYYWMMRKRSR